MKGFSEPTHRSMGYSLSNHPLLQKYITQASENIELNVKASLRKDY
jgi:hypothetical protein